MAQFFARLGTASPQGSGLQGVVSAGLKAAEQTAPDVIATQTKAQARKQERADKKEEREDKKRIEKISNKTKDLEKLQAKYSLLEKKNASQAALAKAETDILEAQATITQLEFQTNTQLRDIMPTNENLKKRLEQLTKGSIVSTAPGYDTAQARALMQAETEVMADLNILQRKSQSAFRETTEGEVSRAILDRALQLLNSNPKFNKNISNNKKDTNENNTQDAGDSINKLLSENE
jgi:phosphopantetheinyl transferase (holo-ACP synthase)